MTPEVKDRIEQIRRGNVPEGYKKVKIGIVPNEWDLCRIEDFCNMKSGDTITASSIYPTGEYPCYGGNGLRGYTSDFTHNGVHVLIGRQGALCGNVKLVNGKFYASEHAVVVDTKSNAVMNFCYYLFDELGLNKYSESSAQPGLSVEKLLRIFTVLPKLEEQYTIAEILTAQDKIIELKEKRLAEKQRQKKYLMQQLLTGKKRLPGFTGEWKFVPAKDVFKAVTDKKHDGSLEVLSATQDRGIVPRSTVDIDIKYAQESLAGYKKVRKGNFVISLRSFQGGIEYSEYDGIVSPAYTVLAAKQPIEDGFYKQFLKSADYISRLNIAVYGIRDGKQIGYDDFGRIKIPYPDVVEQKAISDILTKADHEIELLCSDIEQEKQKKKALMQLLLTGIVRVNV